jgi:molybdopterin-binding protein/molybdate transport repressor ModE-like protein
MSREEWLTPLDHDLLESIARSGSVAGACRALGIGRDRGVYHLERLTELAGGPVVRARRGGAGRGATRLTELGERLRRTPTGSLGRRAPPPGVLRGTFRSVDGPALELAGGLRLKVGFTAPEGSTVAVVVDPESVLLAPGRFPSSARNVLRGRVERVEALDPPTVRVTLRVGGVRLPASVTPGSVAELGLRRGRSVYLYLKATALRPLARPLSPGRPRRSPRRPPPPRGGSASR